MHLACAVSHMVAAKVEYKHPVLDYYLKFVHMRAPVKAVKGKKSTKKPLEEVKEQLRQEA